jgi:hypothetical protein
MSIKWRRRGKTLEDGGKYKVVDESLTIKDVSSDDCGEYYCVARDGHSIITSVGILTIKDGKFICFILYCTLLSCAYLCNTDGTVIVAMEL